MHSFSGRKIHNLHKFMLSKMPCFQDMNLAHKRLSVKHVCLIIFGEIKFCTIVQFYHYTLWGAFHPKTLLNSFYEATHTFDSMMVISLFTGNSTQKDGMCYPWHEEFCWAFRENKMSPYFSDYRENTCGKEQSSKKYIFIISVLVSWNSLSMRSWF